MCVERIERAGDMEGTKRTFSRRITLESDAGADVS